MKCIYVADVTDDEGEWFLYDECITTLKKRIKFAFPNQPVAIKSLPLRSGVVRLTGKKNYIINLEEIDDNYLLRDRFDIQ